VRYPFNVAAKVEDETDVDGDVAGDVLTDVAEVLLADVAGDDAEELKRWPLRRMKVAIEGDIADNFCQWWQFADILAAVQ
jgi:hypothetical protein